MHRGGSSKEQNPLLPNKYAHLLAEPRAPAVWQGGSFRASFGSWACTSRAGEVVFIHGCSKISCSLKAECMA